MCGFDMEHCKLLTQALKFLCCLPCSPVYIRGLPAHLPKLLPVACPQDVLEPAEVQFDQIR